MLRLPGLATAFIALTIACSSTYKASAAEPSWGAGFAKTIITPDEPIWLSGYGSRTKPAEGKQSELFARAAAIRDPQGTTFVVVALDLVGVTPEMGREISEAVEKQHKIPRCNLMLAVSHTHCGPALDQSLTYMLDMKPADWDGVRKYQKILNQKIIETVDKAVKDVKPAKLAFGHGQCGFAVNRRPPIGVGPYDHDVPVLKILGEDNSLRGVIFGYACHATVMSFYQWYGDYPGMACQYVEDRHPGAVALFAAGCGADQNPLPRRKVELAEKYGRMLALSVEEVLEKPMTPVSGPLKAGYRTIDLAFDKIPTQAELEQTAKGTVRTEKVRAEYLLGELKSKGSLPATYPYPVQVWKIGDTFTWVSLGGEVVIDYVLRLKKELGGDKLWVTGYANDVMAYIPSERVLKEGGYEGASSMIVYQQPSPWKPGLEDQIVQAVHDLIKK